MVGIFYIIGVILKVVDGNYEQVVTQYSALGATARDRAQVGVRVVDPYGHGSALQEGMYEFQAEG